MKKYARRWLFVLGIGIFILLVFLLSTQQPAAPLLPSLVPPRLPDQKLFEKLHKTPADKLVLLHPPRWSRSPQLVVIVPSTVDKAEERSLARSLWANSAASATYASGGSRVIFLVGRPKETKGKNNTGIYAEAARHGDILAVDIPETYFNLVYKELAGFRWVLAGGAQPSFVLKADSDVVVDLDRLSLHLSSFHQSEQHIGSKRIIWCKTLDGIPARRNTASRWFVPESAYGSEYFPSYCNGPAYLMRRDTLEAIIVASRRLKVFEVEDAFFTGVSARAAGVRTVCASRIISGSYETSSSCLFWSAPALSVMSSHNFMSPAGRPAFTAAAVNASWANLRRAPCKNLIGELATAFLAIFQC